MCVCVCVCDMGVCDVCVCIFPFSDATRGPLSDQKLTPSPTLLTNEGADIVGGVDHTHLAQLYQLVLSQQREMAALRSEQQAAFASLWRQLEGVQAGLMESQRQTLTEHTREQRILTPSHPHSCTHSD